MASKLIEYLSYLVKVDLNNFKKTFLLKDGNRNCQYKADITSLTFGWSGLWSQPGRSVLTTPGDNFGLQDNTRAI